MNKAFLLFACLLLATSCSSRGGKRGGYSGPPQYEAWAREAIDISIAEMSPVYGRQLRWNWSDWPIRINEVPVEGYKHGRPYVKMDGLIYYGYFDILNGTITVPSGGKVHKATVIHEVGHLVLWRNKEPISLHHDKYWEFFKRRYR